MHTTYDIRFAIYGDTLVAGHRAHGQCNVIHLVTDLPLSSVLILFNNNDNLQLTDTVNCISFLCAYSKIINMFTLHLAGVRSWQVLFIFSHAFNVSWVHWISFVHLIPFFSSIQTSCHSIIMFKSPSFWVMLVSYYYTHKQTYYRNISKQHQFIVHFCRLRSIFEIEMVI